VKRKVSAESAPAPSAPSVTGAKPKASPHAAGPVPAAVEVEAVAVAVASAVVVTVEAVGAAIVNRTFIV